MHRYSVTEPCKYLVFIPNLSNNLHQTFIFADWSQSLAEIILRPRKNALGQGWETYLLSWAAWIVEFRWQAANAIYFFLKFNFIFKENAESYGKEREMLLIYCLSI